jgi:hypothetical protein
MRILIMKARTQTKQKFYGKTSIAYSEHYQCAAVLESDLEVAFLNLIDFEDFADNFEMQPNSIWYKKGRKWIRYTADAVIIINGHAIFIEIKYKKDANKEDLTVKHALLKQHFNKKGQYFLVLTEEDIRAGHRESNLCYLQPALSHPSPIEELKALLSLTKKTSMSIADFYKFQSKHKANDCLVRRAIAHKLILCDLTLHLDKLVLDFTDFLAGV